MNLYVRTVLVHCTQLVKMLVVAVSLFALCWLPMHAYDLLLNNVWPGLAYWPFVNHLYLMAYWLAMSHAAYSPILYCCLNSRYTTATATAHIRYSTQRKPPAIHRHLSRCLLI